MSIKRWDGANQVDVSAIKRFDGSNWIDVNSVKRFDGSNWVEAWSNAPKIKLLMEYNLSSSTYTLLSKNKICVSIQYNGGGPGYSMFYCPDILIPSGSTVSYNITIDEDLYTENYISIGYINSDNLINDGYGPSYESAGNFTGSFTTKFNGYLIIKFTTQYLFANPQAILQINSITINGKTYKPEFRLN